MSIPVGIIVAVGQRDLIGFNPIANEASDKVQAPRLPWHCPPDLKRFRRWTMDCAVIVGRHTWTSLLATRRPPKKGAPVGPPLPGRQIIVVTSQSGAQEQATAEGAVAALPSLDAALAFGRALPVPTIWVAGGAILYAEALRRRLASQLVMTRIPSDPETKPGEQRVLWPSALFREEDWCLAGSASDPMDVRVRFELYRLKPRVHKWSFT